MALLRSLLEQKGRAVGEAISSNSGWVIYKRTRTRTGPIKEARAGEKVKTVGRRRS